MRKINWSASRIFNLISAVLLTIGIIHEGAWRWFVVVAVLILMVIVNPSCGCQGGSCNIPEDKKK